MKHAILASALVPVCFAFACGTKKHEKHVSVPVVDTTSTQVTSTDSTKNTDCASQSNCDTAAIEAGHLVVMTQNSFLNPTFDADGTLQNHEGVCLEKFTAGVADANSYAMLDMSLTHMTLKNDRARCRVQVQVAFKKGYAFAIQKVEIPLSARIPVDSNAVFEGSYGIKGKKALAVNKTLDSRYSEKPLRLDHTVLEQDIVWSGCSGQATLVIDTGLSLNSSGSDTTGDIQLTGETPYRMEVVRAKCL